MLVFSKKNTKTKNAIFNDIKVTRAFCSDNYKAIANFEPKNCMSVIHSYLQKLYQDLSKILKNRKKLLAQSWRNFCKKSLHLKQDGKNSFYCQISKRLVQLLEIHISEHHAKFQRPSLKNK